MEVRMAQERPALSALLFPGMTHAQALERVLADPGTRYAVRERIREDQARDPVDSVADAEVLLALHELRLQEALGAARRGGVVH
jgi:hypothetical protein